MPSIVRFAALGLSLLACATLRVRKQLSRQAGQGHRAVRARRPDRRGCAIDHAETVGEVSRQQFYIENVAGAGGNLGMGNAAKSPGDGYTILFVSSSYTVNTSLYAKPPYDPDKDFAPVTMAATSPNGLFVNPNVIPSKIDQGTGRTAQGQSGQVHVRLARHRHHAAPVERAVQASPSASTSRWRRSRAAVRRSSRWSPDTRRSASRRSRRRPRWSRPASCARSA